MVECFKDIMPFTDLFNKFKTISVYALVGESGTGKSFKAKLLAQKYGIEAIIDDGLLIQDDKILILILNVGHRRDIYDQ